MSIKGVRRRRVTGPLWLQYDMEVLKVLLARLQRAQASGIRVFGGRIAPPVKYAMP